MTESVPAVNSVNVQVSLASNETQEQIIDKEDVLIDDDDDDQLHKPKRQKRSEVWSEMIEVEDPKGGENKFKYKCKHCHQLLAKIGSGTTSHLRRHLESCVRHLESKKNMMINSNNNNYC